MQHWHSIYLLLRGLPMLTPFLAGGSFFALWPGNAQAAKTTKLNREQPSLHGSFPKVVIQNPKQNLNQLSQREFGWNQVNSINLWGRHFFSRFDCYVAGLLPARTLLSEQNHHAMRRFREISRQDVDAWDLLAIFSYQLFSFGCHLFEVFFKLGFLFWISVCLLYCCFCFFASLRFFFFAFFPVLLFAFLLFLLLLSPFAVLLFLLLLSLFAFLLLCVFASLFCFASLLFCVSCFVAFPAFLLVAS